MANWGEVLIVDDSSTSRMIIQRCFQMAGIEASGFAFAENGVDAIAVLKEKPGIGLILTDINMPKMDGHTFARLIKSDARTSSIPLVVISSIADGALVADLKAVGVLSVIKKPVSPAKILEALGGAS